VQGNLTSAGQWPLDGSR